MKNIWMIRAAGGDIVEDFLENNRGCFFHSASTAASVFNRIRKRTSNGSRNTSSATLSPSRRCIPIRKPSKRPMSIRSIPTKDRSVQNEAELHVR